MTVFSNSSGKTLNLLLIIAENCCWEVHLLLQTAYFFYLSGEKGKIFRGKDFFFTPLFFFHLSKTIF